VALLGHARFETFSVLTRLPPPHRISPSVAIDLIDRRFGLPWWPSEADQHELWDQLGVGAIRGGGVYDALVAGAARAAGLELLTADRRAAITYEAVGADVRFVA
jgi:hypothetical protein